MSAEPEGKHWLVWFIILLQATVVFGFFIGLYLLYQDYSFSRRAVLTSGEVVRIDYGKSVSGMPYATTEINIFPTFAYTDQSGHRQTVTPIVAMAGHFRIGEVHDILIDPTNPTARVALAGWQFYMGIGGITLMATTPMTFIIVWAHIRQKQLENQKRLRRNRKARERRARIKAEKLAAKQNSPRKDS